MLSRLSDLSANISSILMFTAGVSLIWPPLPCICFLITLSFHDTAANRDSIACEDQLPIPPPQRGVSIRSHARICSRCAFPIAAIVPPAFNNSSKFIFTLVSMFATVWL